MGIPGAIAFTRTTLLSSLAPSSLLTVTTKLYWVPADKQLAGRARTVVLVGRPGGRPELRGEGKGGGGKGRREG